MTRVSKITAEGWEILEREAKLRAEYQSQHRSNKQLAAKLGLAPMYVAQVVVGLKRKHQRVDDPRGTISEQYAQQVESTR